LSVGSKLEVDDCWHTGLLCLLSYDLAPRPRSKEVGTAAEGIGTPPSPAPKLTEFKDNPVSEDTVYRAFKWRRE
jgi:hypothetical protein